MDVAVDTDVLLEQAARLIIAGRGEAARPVLAAVRDANAPRWAELMGLLELRAGQLAAARAVLDAGIAANPAHGALRRLRAEVCQRQGDLPQALADAADAVLLDRDDPTAKALLGTLLLQVGQAKDAELCLAEAVAARPTQPGFRRALAAAREAMGAPDQAAEVLYQGILAAPHDIALRNDAVLLAVRRRDFSGAVILAEAARKAGVMDACLFGLLGHALSSMDRHADAAGAYEEALKLGPDDPYVRHLVAAAGILPQARRAPADYVRTVFDGYASRFETHLIGLGYRVPGLLRTALLQHTDGLRPDVSVLDLGCGTGLMGVVLSDLVLGTMVGVDLSPRMLEQARAKGIYAALHLADITAYLVDTTECFPVILAADVLCYFGDLSDMFSLIAARLAPGGLFLCSLEELADPGEAGWRLGRQGRYAHRAEYVLAAVEAAGLAVRLITQESLRQEAGADVAGFLLVAEQRG